PAPARYPREAHFVTASRSAPVCRKPEESAPAVDQPARHRTRRATLLASLTSRTPLHLGFHFVLRLSAGEGRFPTALIHANHSQWLTANRVRGWDVSQLPLGRKARL